MAIYLRFIVIYSYSFMGENYFFFSHSLSRFLLVLFKKISALVSHIALYLMDSHILLLLDDGILTKYIAFIAHMHLRLLLLISDAHKDKQRKQVLMLSLALSSSSPFI